MKLNKDNFKKTIDKDIVRYSYNCNDTNFYLELVGQNKDRNINVFSGSVDDRQNLLTTKDTLQAWNYFEDMLKVCGGEQGSSGGGNLGQNPQQNPNILPLMAFGSVSGGMRQITLFAQMDDGTQAKIFDFNVGATTIPSIVPSSVFEVDWSDEEIPQLLKCEVLLKEYANVKFEEEPSRKVFLFIPKSITNQGGEEGGNTSGGQEGEGEGEGKGEGEGQKGEPTQKEAEGESENESGESGKGGEGGEGGEGEQQEGETQQSEGEGQEGQEGEQTSQQSSPSKNKPDSDEKGDKQDDEGGGQNQLQDLNFSDTIQQLATSTNGEYNPSELLSIFRNVESGELWLSSNNFPKIKKDLNLPQNTTPRQLSQIIINSK